MVSDIGVDGSEAPKEKSPTAPAGLYQTPDKAFALVACSSAARDAFTLTPPLL